MAACKTSDDLSFCLPQQVTNSDCLALLYGLHQISTVPMLSNFAEWMNCEDMFLSVGGNVVDDPGEIRKQLRSTPILMQSEQLSGALKPRRIRRMTSISLDCYLLWPDARCGTIAFLQKCIIKLIPLLH